MSKRYDKELEASLSEAIKKGNITEEEAYRVKELQGMVARLDEIISPLAERRDKHQEELGELSHKVVKGK